MPAEVLPPTTTLLFAALTKRFYPVQRELLTAILLCAFGLLVITGCERDEAPADFVARVGNQYLTTGELKNALQNLAADQDSAEARQQIIEQWVTSELLFQEAQRRGLRDKEEVQRLLRENERSVMVSALVSSLYEEAEIEPSPEEIKSYYNRHREQLKLREPFARVRHLATASPDSAAQARQLLQEAVIAGRADSIWSQLVDRYALKEGQSRELASHFYPVSRLFRNRPEVRATLGRLSDGQIAPLLRTDSLSHLLQLVKRMPAGSEPRLSWIEDQLKQRLTIQARKQMYARQVQRLRNEALARENLKVRQ